MPNRVRNRMLKLVTEQVGQQAYTYLPLGEYVVAAKGFCGGRPVIKYHRLDARHLLALVAAGETPRQIARTYKIPVQAVEEVIELASQYDYEKSYA
jgi:uncharacterized protein (DUF433 family)